MQKITPFLWFNDNAEEAVNLYVSIFKDSRIVTKSAGTEMQVPDPKGMIMTVSFRRNRRIVALSGGPEFPFTEAISFYVSCKTQAEVDELWEKLTAGGEESECGWLKDKFGVSWQIVPTSAG